MNNQGWVSIHRKITENPIATKPEYAWLWIMLLLLANHQDNSFIWNNKKITIKKGQLLTGRFELSKKTGISENKVYRILKYLENEQQIEQQKTNKYTVITILNWERYQQNEQQNEQQVNNKRTTSEQQVNTNNNDNNDNKREQEDKLTKKDLLSLNEDYLKRYKEKYTKLTEDEIIEQAEQAYYWLTAKGKTQKDYNAFMHNWLKKSESFKARSNNYPKRRTKII